MQIRPALQIGLILILVRVGHFEGFEIELI